MKNVLALIMMFGPMLGCWAIAAADFADGHILAGFIDLAVSAVPIVNISFLLFHLI